MNSTIELDFWLRLLGILALEISMVVALAFAAQALTQSAFWRRALWQSCFVGLLLLVASEFSGAGRGLAIWFTGKPVAEPKISVRILPVDESFVSAPIENEIPLPVEFSEKPASANRSVWWPGTLWLAGLALIAMRIIFARILFVALRWRKEQIRDVALLNRVSELALRLGIRRKIHLLESPGFSSPMTFGIAQSCIALPKGFSRNFTLAEQDAMLAHELAHVAARDPFWHLLADIASALLWWHPLVWWGRRRLHSASELAADEAVAIFENGPGTLAECLVNLGQRLAQPRSFGWLGVDGNGFRSHLGQRVERLLNLKPAEKNKLRGWPLFLAKTAFTILFGGLIVFTSGWIQNGKAPREKDFTSAVQSSWNASFASTALAALAVEREESSANETQANGHAAKTPHYDEVTFDTLIFENVPVEKLNDVLDGLDLNGYEPTLRRMFGVTWLSSSELPKALAALSTFKELMVATNDMVGSKASGIPIIYQGNPTNRENSCNYFTETKDGLSVVTRAEMSYRTTHVWRFSVVPQKQADSTELKVFWTEDGKHTPTQFKMPIGGGVVVRRRSPDDSSNVQLIVFSSLRAFTQLRPGEKAKLMAGNLVKDGKLLFETGKFDEAEAKLNDALKIDSENKAAFYYKSLIQEAKSAKPGLAVELLRPTIPPTTLRKTIVDGPKPSQFIPAFKENDALPLYTRTFLLDPEEFLRNLESALPDFTNESNEQSAGHTSSDKANRQSRVNRKITAFLTAFGVDFGQGRTTTGKSLFFNEQSGRLLVRASKDDLEIIQKALENLQGVVIAPGTPHKFILQSRVFKLNPKTFSKKMGGASSPNFLSKIENYLREAGVDFGTEASPNGKTIYYKDSIGWLMVRVSPDDLEKVEKALAPFKADPPQVLIETKFVEIDEAGMKKLGLNWFAQNATALLTNQTAFELFLSATNVTKANINAAELSGEPLSAMAGIFTAAQYEVVLKALEKAGGTDILAAPKVTTLSDRQAVISVQNARTIVNGPGLPPSANTNIVSTNGLWAENIFTGPVLDVLPAVSADGFAIQMTLTGTVSEFLGYYDAVQKWFEEKPPSTSSLIGPQVRLRRVKSDAKVWDGQTVLLALEDKNQVVPRRKHLFLFVTASIIDATGNRVHTDEDLRSITNPIPRQP